MIEPAFDGTGFSPSTHLPNKSALGLVYPDSE